MTAAILCPGPSVSKFVPAGEVLFAVNRAATFFRCDVWCAGDLPLVQKTREQVIGLPLLFTDDNTAGQLQTHGPNWPGSVRTFGTLRDFLDPERPQWSMFSFTAAVVLAAALGHTRIACYGCDWSGDADFDGWREAGNRSEDRWSCERGIFGALQIVLKARGIDVQRVTL